VREQVPPEGFDKDQERRLKSKKKSQTYQSEEEKWKSVYRVLFQDDGEADIPTPYIEYQPCTGQTAEPSNIVRFQEFARLELPRLVRRTLEAVVEQEAQPLEDKMKERLVDIVKECQTQLLSMFQTISGTSIDKTVESSSVASIEQVADFVTTGTSNQVANVDSSEMFIDFDAHPGDEGDSFRPSEPQSLVTGPKLPTSSNSSDSGYDSTWPATHASNPLASHMAFDLLTNNAHVHAELDNCFELFDNRIEAMQQAPMSMIDEQSCWSFVENGADATDLGMLEAQWDA
jgi:hypothetical protein